MGAVLACLIPTAVILLEIPKLLYFFLILVPFSGLLWRRNDDPRISPYMPTIAFKCKTPEYQDQFKDQKIDIQWWNRQTGEAWACWRGYEGQCGVMQGLWLYCWDWSESGVPDDLPKLGFDGTQPYTPNGTVYIKTPKGNGPVNATWLAPIAGDCKYWDENWKWPEHKQEFQHTNVTALSELYRENQWMPPKKKIPNLGSHQPASSVSRRDPELSNLELENYFSKLPRRSFGTDIGAFAVDGAALLRRSLQQESENGTHAMLHRAFATILKAHASEPQTHSFRKRVVGRMTGDFGALPADTAIDQLTDALMAGSHEHDKRRMETFAVSSVFQAITDRAQKGDPMGEAEFRALARVWERVFKEENGARR